MHLQQTIAIRVRIIAFLFITSIVVSTTILSLKVLALPNPSQPSNPTQNDQKTQADRLLQQGINQHKNGQFREALQSVQQALTMYQTINDVEGIANCLSSLGNTYFSLGEYRQAIGFYQQSLKMMQANKNRQGEAENLVNLSNAYLYLGQEQEAKKFERQAQTVRREIGNPTREAAFLSNIGLAHESQGQHQQAIEFYQQQLQIAQDSDNRTLQVDSLNSLAQAYQSLGQHQKAIELLKQQLEIARKTGDDASIANSLKNLATAYESLGQHHQAIELYQQQLEIAQKKGDRTSIANSLKNLAAAYESQEQYPQAIELYQQQLQIAKEKSDRVAEGTAFNNIALALLKSKKLAEAQKTLLEAMKVWEAIRAKLGSNDNYFAQQATTYKIQQQVLIAQNQTEAALELSEQERVKAIVRLLGLRLSSEPVGTGLQPAPVQLTLPTIQVIKQIAKAQKATLVEYSIISDQEIYVWVVQPTGEVAFRRIDIKSSSTIYPISSIEKLVTNSLKSIGALAEKTPSESKSNKNASEVTDPANQRQPLLQLYQILIKPIEDLLPKDSNTRVIFIPHQELFLVPFPALVDITDKSLIEKHTILTIPAIQVLELTKQQRQKVSGKKVIVVGNPTMPSVVAKGEPTQSLPPLLSAQQEALEIAQLLNTKALTGNQATKSAFLQQLPEARIIHLATYGLLNDMKGQGVPGAIAFAPSGNDNGILTASEILNFHGQPKESPLKAELVVLSAGDTGHGKITGDGVIGLSLSLISAGVPSIIMSLGSAPDASTGYLMTKFYQQLKQTGDKAQALRQAMLSTMKQYPNSKKWAGFTLIGEP